MLSDLSPIQIGSGFVLLAIAVTALVLAALSFADLAGRPKVASLPTGSTYQLAIANKDGYGLTDRVTVGSDGLLTALNGIAFGNATTTTAGRKANAVTVSNPAGTISDATTIDKMHFSKLAHGAGLGFTLIDTQQFNQVTPTGVGSTVTLRLIGSKHSGWLGFLEGTVSFTCGQGKKIVPVLTGLTTPISNDKLGRVGASARTWGTISHAEGHATFANGSLGIPDAKLNLFCQMETNGEITFQYWDAPALSELYPQPKYLAFHDDYSRTRACSVTFQIQFTAVLGDAVDTANPTTSTGVQVPFRQAGY